MSAKLNTTPAGPYTPLAVLAVVKQMSAKKLRAILLDAGVTCFSLRGCWQVSQPEFDAFEQRCADEARRAAAEEIQR
jgi:hypothetical protein